MAVVIPPWLDPPNFIQAAEAGARIGEQQHESAVNALLEREKLGQQAQESAGQLGLGYARVRAETAQAAAARKEAEARLALQAGRYSDLNTLGQARLADTVQQQGAANDLRAQDLGLRTQTTQNTQDYHNRMLDLEQQRIEKMGVPKEEARALAEKSTTAAITAMSDPRWQTDPMAVLRDYPDAANNALVKIDFQNRGKQTLEENKPSGPAKVTTFTPQGEVTYSVPARTAAAALGTNALGGVPAPAAPAAAPAKPKRVQQNGVIYELQPDGSYKPVQ